MPSFTDLTTAEVFLMGLNMLGACLSFAVTLLARRRLAARVVIPGVVWLLGVAVVLAGMLCALTMQAQEGSKQASNHLRLIPISEAGKDAGLAEEKPRARYYREVVAQVERKWLQYLKQNDVPRGRVEIGFYVNAKGGVENVRVVNEAPPPPILTDLTLRAIHDADIAPIPAEVIPTLRAEDGGRMKVVFGARVPEPPQLIQMMDEADKVLAKVDKVQEKPIPKALPVMDDEPVTRTTRNQDPNAFTPFTRKSETKGATVKRGKEASVDTADTAMGRYYRQVTGQVEKKWSIYLHLRRPEGLSKGCLQLVFYVNKKGKVEGLKVVNDKESNELLTEITLQAIKDAEIPPMPADVFPLLPMNDPERLKIQYDALIY